jgi:endonuclease YncB( thermonuclease family)
LRLGTRATALLMLAGCLAALPAHADFAGTVASVHDGDTLTVRTNDRTIRLRLAEIDAPERAQAFGEHSRQSLVELCAGKRVHVVIARGTDRYGRTLGRISCEGVDANAEQVRRGMAWIFDRYAVDLNLYALQADARAAGRGLWADPQPLPPSEWRRSRLQASVPGQVDDSGAD